MHGVFRQNADGMGDEEEDRRADLAFELVEEALADYEHLLTPELFEVMRAVMVAELLDTPEGQRTLREVSADPVVGASGAVAKEGAPSVAAKGTGNKTGT